MTYSARSGWLGWATGLLLICGAPATAAQSAPAGPDRGAGDEAVPAAVDQLPHRRVSADTSARRLPARSASRKTKAPQATPAKAPAKKATRGRIGRAPASIKVTGTLTSIEEVCPVGLRRTTTLYQDSFEKGDLPEPTLTTGFGVADSEAGEGSRFARSILTQATATAPDKPYHTLFLPLLSTSRTARTIVSLRVKGDFGKDTAYVAVNDNSGWIEPSAQWGAVTLDVTAAVNAPSSDRAAGEMDVRVLNYPQSITGSTTLDIDDVHIYQCAPPAATGVRGDFNGDGISDLISVDRTGDLVMSAGRRNGTLGAPQRIGHGWARMTWIGSPGDLTGDRRPDVLARRADGVLLLYAGHGMGRFSRARVIGVGWQGMTSILTPGDTNGDRVPELLARDASGRLLRWSFTPGGRALVAKAMIGFGFGTYTRLLAPGDLNRDGRGDLVGIRADGVMLAHYPDRIGRLGRALGLSQGWSVFTAVSAPGDLNGDSRGDLVAGRADGSLWTFLSLSKVTGIQAGSHANRFRLFG